MDFTVKTVVLLLFLLDVYGKSIPLEDGIEKATEDIVVSTGTCEFNGTSYSLDSVFASPDNPCLICYCNENWTGVITDASCRELECDALLGEANFDGGCIPVYDETKCCVIDFYCRDNVVSNVTEETEKDNEVLNEYENEESNYDSICPTPQCADESCRIEIPPEQFCPTCICEGLQEKNEFESPSQPERHPLEAQNTSEDGEALLIPVPWSGVPNGEVSQEESAYQEANYDGDSERVEVSSLQPSDNGNKNQISREMVNADSSNIIYERMEEPRRRRSTNSQTAMTSSFQQQQQQQQRWTVLEDDAEGDQREHEDSNDSSEDYGEMKIFSQRENETAESTNEISDLYDEESVVWEKIVPGCPTPLCESSRCRIGIPQGHHCPTCICSRRNRQP